MTSLELYRTLGLVTSMELDGRLGLVSTSLEVTSLELDRGLAHGMHVRVEDVLGQIGRFLRSQYR